MVSFFGTETVPSSGASSPTTMRKRVVLPEPLGPTRPTFSPGFNWKEASTKMSCLPYCLLMLEKEINYHGSKVAQASDLPVVAPQNKLLLAQNYRRVHARRLPRGNVTARHRRQRQQSRYPGKYRGVGGADRVEQRREIPGQRQRGQQA